MNEQITVEFPDNSRVIAVVLGTDDNGNFKCSAIEQTDKFRQGDIFYCNEDTHKILKHNIKNMIKLSNLKQLLSNYVHRKNIGYDVHRSPWKFNKITGTIEKDPEAIRKLAKRIKKALAENPNEVGG